MKDDQRPATGGLRRARDDRPGLTRRRAGRGFSYRDVDGATDPDEERAVVALLRARLAEDASRAQPGRRAAREA